MTASFVAESEADVDASSQASQAIIQPSSVSEYNQSLLSADPSQENDETKTRNRSNRLGFGGISDTSNDPFISNENEYELVFKGLFGGLLAGQGGYSVANFSTISFGKDARSTQAKVDSSINLRSIGRENKGYTSGLKLGASVAGSLKTLYQYSSPNSGSDVNLLSFKAEESFGGDFSVYRSDIFETGARFIASGQLDVYALLEQKYNSDTGLPEWLQSIGLATGIAGDTLSLLSTPGILGYELKWGGSGNGQNPFSSNGFGFFTDEDGLKGDPKNFQNIANAIGLTSAALSIGTIIGAASANFNQYGTASRGIGSEQAVHLRLLSKYGYGIEAIIGAQENTLWDFSGNPAGADEQILAFGSAGAALAFGGYIPLLQASYTWNSKPSTTSRTELSAPAVALAAPAETPKNPSGSYEEAPTGISYPMGYAPAFATDALYTTPGEPLASLTGTPTNLYLYQLSAFAAVNLSTGALTWPNSGAGYLNDGDYTNVPLIGLSLPGSATATASFTVTGGLIVPANFSVQLPQAQPGQAASGQYLGLPQATSGIYSFGVDVFQQVAGNPAPPPATGASSVHTAMPLLNIDTNLTNVLAVQPIARIQQQISLKDFQQSTSYLATQTSASSSNNDSKLISYANVAVVLYGTATAQAPQQVTTLNPGTATVNLVNGKLISVILDQPLYFTSQAGYFYSLVPDLATALGNTSIVNPSLSVTPQLEGLADFTDQYSFTANPTANNAGVYLSAGLIDTLPLLSSYGHWPVQNRVTYVDGANTVYLNNTSGSNWTALTPSDLTLSQLSKNPDRYQFSAASEPTSITDSSSNTTYVFWVEASDSVVPLSGRDGEANYQAFMDDLYGDQRINYSFATTSQAGTNTTWNYISLADLYSSPGNIITNLRAFSVQVEVNGAPQTRSLLVWSELPISAIQNAENRANTGSQLPDSPQAKLYAGFINPNAADIPGGYQWDKLFYDSNNISTIQEIPWTSDSGSGLSIADLSAASQLIQVPSGASGATDTVLTPVLSWSQAVRTPYNEAVLASQPALFLPLGSLQSGSNAINIGSANVNTETFASSTGLNTAIAGALTKSTAAAVQNVQGLGVLATGLGSTNKPILDLLRNIPQADRNSAQSDPVAIFSGTIDATTLTVSSLSQGTLEVGELLVGAGVAAGTTITSIKTAATATTAGVYTLSSASSVATTTTLRTLPESNTYSYSSFNGSFSGTGGSNGYTTLTVSGLSGSLQIGDRVLGLGLPGGSFVVQVQSPGVYTLNQGPDSAGGSYGLAALPGGSSSPYSIEFWTQLAPGSNPAGAGLVNLGQASAAALPDRPAATPEGWLLSSSFVVEQLTNQDALKLGLISALPANGTDSDPYGWRWALVADGANTTAMGGNGGANLNRNALVLDNLVVGDRIEGVNTFLANYGLTSSDLLGIDGTPADQIAAVPNTQLQFSTDLTSNAAVQAEVAETTLNGVAIDTSSAVMNGGIVTNGAASVALAAMFDQLSIFELKTGQAKVNFSLNPNTQTNPPAPSTPSSTQLETYGGLALQFALLPGPAVSVNGSGQIAFDVAPGKTLLSTDGTDLRSGDWHYVVASFLPDYVTYSADGSLVDVASNVGTASLYIDGKQVASVANVVNPYAPSNVNDYAQLLSDNAQGSIDLVALYDKALTTLSEPQSVSSWPLPTGQDALALMKEAGFVVASKTPNPGAIPGAVSNHWLAHTVDPNNALNSTYTATLIPDGDGGGTWNEATALNPVAAPQATIPSASTSAAQQDLLIAINPSDWSKPGWFSTTATKAAAFNPAGNDLKAITVQLTPSSTGDTVVRTLTPEQVLMGTKAQTSLAELQPLAQDQDFNYTFLSNTPALNLLISRQPNANDSGDSNSLDPKLSYTASVTLTFEDGSTVSNTPSGSSSSSGTGLALGFSSSLASELKATSSTSRKALATAAVLEEAPLQLKYVDSGEVFSSQSTTADSPASTFGMSQVAGYSANSNGTTQNGWLAIAQPRSTNAKNDPAGRVWINYTGQFTLDASTNQRTASTDAANAPSTWLNALASSNFNPQAPNLPLLNSALNKSSVGGLLIKADPSAGWSQNFGANMLVADVNNDGTQDLIISAPQANGGGAVVVVNGEWIASNLTASTGETILDLSNPSNLGPYVTVLTPGKVNTNGTDITTAAGFGTALAFDTITNTLWIGAPNYLRTLDSSATPNASTQPIGALYSYSTSAYPDSWDSGKATILSGAILGSGGTLTTTQAGNTSSTSYWGAQFGTAVAVSSSGELAVSAPGVMGSMLYTGTEAAKQVYLQGNRHFTADVPEGVLSSIQLEQNINATGGPTSTLLKPISSLTAKKLTSQQKAFLTQLKDQAVTQVAPATTVNNQALQSGAVGAVVMFQPGTNYTGLANSAITPEAIAGLNGTTFIGANPINTQGDSGFGSSLTFADLTNTNSQQLIVGASSSNGGGLVYTIDPSTPGTDISLGSNQYLAILAATNVFTAAEAFDGLGNGLVSLGDVNNDGYDDVLLQAYNASSGAGNAYVLFGSDQLATAASNAGLASLASGSIGTIAYKQGSSGTIAILSELGSAGSLTGQGNYGAGDINADGYNDILLGSGALADAYLTWGHPYLESITDLQLSKLTSNTGFMLDGLATSNQGSLRSIGDFNGDGYGDFISINPGSNLTTVRIELGANTQEILADAAYSYYTFTVANGTEVLPGGDINGDGMDDIVLFLDQNLSSAADGNQGAGSSTGILYGRSSADLPLGSGFGFIAPVDPSTSAPLAPLPGDSLAGGLTDAAPSVIAVGDTLYAAVKGVDSDSTDTSIWFTQSTDGGNTWSILTDLSSINAGFSTSTGPSLAYFNETLYLSFVDSAGTLSLSSWDPTSNNPTAWSTPYQLSNSANPGASYSSSYSPQLIERGDALGITWAAADDSPAITWSNNLASASSTSSPALAMIGSTVYMAIQGANNSIQWTSSTDNGANWTAWQTISGITTSAQPSLAVMNGILYLSYINSSQINITSLADSGTNSWSASYAIPGTIDPAFASLIAEKVGGVQQLAAYYVDAKDSRIDKAYSTSPNQSSGWVAGLYGWLSNQYASAPLALTSYNGQTYIAYQSGNIGSPGDIYFTTNSQDLNNGGDWTSELAASPGNATGIGLSSGPNGLILSYGNSSSPSALQIAQFSEMNGSWTQGDIYNEQLPSNLSNNVSILYLGEGTDLYLGEGTELLLAGANTPDNVSGVQAGTVVLDNESITYLYSSYSTTPDGSNAEGSWAAPTQLLQRTESDSSINFVPITTTDAPSFTWLGDVPILALNNNGTINVYAGTQSGATLQLASSFLAPAGLSIVSAPVLTTTDTGLALTYTNSDGSISLQRLNLVSSNGTPLPGVQFTNDGGIDVSQADLQWQSTILTESNSGISSSLASTPVSVNGNLLLTNVRNTTSQDSQIWINAVPNASDPDSTTWLNSTVQLPDGNGGWILSQQAGGVENLNSAQTGSTISAIGDINNDGYDDLAITANNVAYSPSGNFAASTTELVTGLRLVLGAATATALSSANANDSTTVEQTVQIAGLYPQPSSSQAASAVTPVANLSGPTTLNLNGALGGSSYQISSTSTDFTATGSNPASLQQLFAGARATSTSIPTWHSALGTGSPALQTLSGFGDLNADGYVDYLAPDGLNNVFSSDGAIGYDVWSIRAAGDVNGNGVDDVLLTVSPAETAGQWLQTVLLDGTLFHVENNQFSLSKAEGSAQTGWSTAGLKEGLDPYQYAYSKNTPKGLQQWVQPILNYQPTNTISSFATSSTNTATVPIPGGGAKTAVSCISPDGTTYITTSGNGLMVITYGVAGSAASSWKTAEPYPSLGGRVYSSAIYDNKIFILNDNFSNYGVLNIAWADLSSDLSQAASWSNYVPQGVSNTNNPYSVQLVNEGDRLALYYSLLPASGVTNTSAPGVNINVTYSRDPVVSSSWGSTQAGTGFTGNASAVQAQSSGDSSPSAIVATTFAATRFQGQTILAYYSGDYTNSSYALYTAQATSAKPGTSFTTQSTTFGIQPPKSNSPPSPPPLNLAASASQVYLMNNGNISIGSFSGQGTTSALQFSSQESVGSFAAAIPFVSESDLYLAYLPLRTELGIVQADLTQPAPSQVSLAGYSIDGNIDINGDGFMDILVSDPSDPSKSVNNQYALFGGDYLNIASQVGTAGNDTLIGTPLADVIYTIGGSDRVISNGGADVIYTGSGDDQISIVGPGFIRIDAGSGFDVLQLEGQANQSYDFRLNVSAPEYFAGTKLRDIELITSSDFGANTLYFDAAAVNAINPDRILFLTPDASDTIILSQEFEANPSFNTTYAGSLWTAYAAGVQTTPADSSPALIYVLNPSGASASDWLADHVLISDTPAEPVATSLSTRLAAGDSSGTVGGAAQAAQFTTSKLGKSMEVQAFTLTSGDQFAKYVVTRGDSSQTQVVTYSTTARNSKADTNVDYIAAVGQFRLEVGEYNHEVWIPTHDALKLKNRSSITVEFEEHFYSGQKEFNLLIEANLDTLSGDTPVISGFHVEVDEPTEKAKVSFRADTNSKNLDQLTFTVSSRPSADTLELEESLDVVISDFSLTKAPGANNWHKLDRDVNTNQQVSVMLGVNLYSKPGQPLVSVLGPELNWQTTVQLLNGNQVRFQQDAPLTSWRADSGAGLVTFGLQSGSNNLTLISNAQGGSAGSLNSNNANGATSWQTTEGKAIGSRSITDGQNLEGSDWTPTASLDGVSLALLNLAVDGNQVTASFEGGVTGVFWQADGNAPSLLPVPVAVEVHRLAGYNNSLGFYSVDKDSITGMVAGINPGENGYLQAALARSQEEDLLLNASTLPAFGATSTFNFLPLDTRERYGVLLLQNGDETKIFSSFAAANEGGATQMVSLSNSSNSLVLGIEDMSVAKGLGDNDFNDIIVKIQGVSLGLF